MKETLSYASKVNDSSLRQTHKLWIKGKYMASLAEGLSGSIIGLSFVVFGYRGYEFWKETPQPDFLEDILFGLGDTFTAGWNHPAFGICCLWPALVLVFYALLQDDFQQDDTESDNLSDLNPESTEPVVYDIPPETGDEEDNEYPF